MKRSQATKSAPEGGWRTRAEGPAFRSQISAMLDAMRETIVSGSVTPGAKMPIGPICERFEVSPGAVREALSRLVAEGLVVAEEQRGFRVTPISYESLMEITHVRILIESDALRRSIGRGDTHWEAHVLAAFHCLSKAPYFEDEATGSPRSWAVEHEAFHRSLIAACGSDWLLRFHDMLFVQTERYRRLNRRYQSQDEPGERRDVHGQHRTIMEAVLRRDAEAAVSLMSEHFLGTARRVGKAYSETGVVATAGAPRSKARAPRKPRS